MAQTPDDDNWLEQIRCPQYFDFEAALTVPLPNSGDCNPPLRDSVYESDDETRTFFRTLEKDFSLHHTPHSQENSPPRADLRNLRPIYRHRPTTSFEQYLQKFKDSQHANHSRESQSPVPRSINSAPHTPNSQEKEPLTPRRNPQGKPSRTPPTTSTASNGELKTPTLESIPTPKTLKKDPSPPSRLRFHKSTEVTRKSAPNEPVPLRRRRPPERITPPLNPVAAKTTSGGFGRAKSRKAIARSDNVDEGQGHTSRLGRRHVSSENIVSPKRKSEKIHSEEKENAYGWGDETNLIDIDPDILRMMEEHNQRIQRKQAQNEHNVGKENTKSGNADTMNNPTREQNVQRLGMGITLRSRRREVPGALQLDENLANSEKLVKRQVSSLHSKGTLAPEVGRRFERQGSECSPGANTNQQVQKIQSRRKTGPSLRQNENVLSEASNNDNGEEPSLDELLKCENERVLEERKKRLPERRRALQVDKNTALKTFEGQRAEHDRQRTMAKVEFTSAKGNSRVGTSALFENHKEIKYGNRDRGKENRTRGIPLPTISRKRGLKGFRERSKMGSSHPGSSGLSTVPHAQRPRSTAGTRRRQPYTDKIKATEKQKRLEKRLEEDLQSLLSQHNSRVRGNRKACIEDER